MPKYWHHRPTTQAMSPTITASPTPAATEPRFEKPAAPIKQVSPAGENPPAYAPANNPEFMPFR